MARTGLIMAAALAFLPMSLGELRAHPEEISGFGFAWITAKEIAFGAMLGWLIGLVFQIPQVVGDFVDNQRGASIARVFNPAQGEESSPLGLVLSQAFLVWFVVGGGLLLFHEIVIESYRVYPVLAPIPAIGPEALEGLLGVFSGFLKLAVLLAMPVVFIMMLAELGLGLVSRFAPQMNVFFLSMSVKSVLGILVILLYLSLLIDNLSESGWILDPAKQMLDGLSNEP